VALSYKPQQMGKSHNAAN